MGIVYHYLSPLLFGFPGGLVFLNPPGNVLARFRVDLAYHWRFIPPVQPVAE
jgi:hypothetical protein